MPANRLSALFDRKPRHSKSTSNLAEITQTQSLPIPSLSWLKSKSRERSSMMFEYKFDRTIPQPRHAPPPPPARAVSPLRASTTPLLHPPDELYLKAIRRRSASARLEENRIRTVHSQSSDCSDWEDATPTPVALACALPPHFFDMPPEYESPQHEEPIHLIRTRATIERLRDSELFLDDPLKLQIDDTISKFRGFQLTEATPTSEDTLVSPINDIDNIYLERRKQRAHQKEIMPLNVKSRNGGT